MAAARQVALDLKLHPKQVYALNTVGTEVLYGGAAGGGKSHLMRIAAIVWATKISGIQIYLFRRLLDDLEKNHIEGPNGFRTLLAPWIKVGLVKMVEGEIRFWNGSKIWLCHCKDEKDRFKYLGAEIHVLLIDELTTFTEVIYRFLRGRVRMVGLTIPDEYKGQFPRILASSNPGGVGHTFVKASFIDGAQPMELRAMNDNEGGMTRQYIPARLDDNPSMEKDDPGYRAKLRGLGSPALVQAMENGDWNVVAGAFFPEFNTHTHVILPFEVPPYWTRFTALDWGSAKPFSVGWYAISDGSPVERPGEEPYCYPAGAMIKYREWYGCAMNDGEIKPNVGIKLTAEELADGIKKREGRERVDYRVADPAMWNVDGGPSLAERMQTLPRKIFMRPADNKRISGWDAVRERLRGDDEKPMLYVFSTCVHFIRTFPALQHDQYRIEDLDTDAEDHAADETRYACMSRPWTSSNVVEFPLRGMSELTMKEAWKLARPERRANSERI